VGLLVKAERGDTRTARLEVVFVVFKAARIASMQYVVRQLVILGEQRQAEDKPITSFNIELNSLMF